MSEIDAVEGLETTGRYLVTYRKDAKKKTLDMLENSAGVKSAAMMSSLDFGEEGVDFAQLDSEGGVLLDHVGVAVVSAPPEAVASLNAAEDQSAILAIEPEGVMHAIQETLTGEYLRGFRDAASSLLESMKPSDVEEFGIAQPYADTASLTWGLQATRVDRSPFTGDGIKVAVLDTGLFLAHPDFQGRQIVSKSFVPGVPTANDGHGHGTHCTGTACGPLRPATTRRYGVAHKAPIYIGKVLSDQGSGGDGGILAGIDWAIANGCAVISMSLGADVPTTSVAYETAGQRALDAGALIIAAAGNNASRASGQFGFVGRPANSRSVLAVAAVDPGLAMGYFSARDTVRQPGTAIDIAAPGVAIFSSWIMPDRYKSIPGTSMATPHVAGIAALWAEKTGARGAALWQQLIANAQSLPLPNVDVGRGLVQAP